MMLLKLRTLERSLTDWWKRREKMSNEVENIDGQIKERLALITKNALLKDFLNKQKKSDISAEKIVELKEKFEEIDKEIITMDLEEYKRYLADEGFLDLEDEGQTYEIGTFLTIEPADVVDIRLMTTKLTQSLITTPMHELLASQLAINVASKRDKDNGNDVLTYFEIIEHPSIKLPDNFEFTEKTARYIDAVGSALESPTVRDNGGVIKVKHLINIMNGKNASNVKEEEVESVIKDLDLLSSINIYFDTTEHADYDKKRKGKNNWIGSANRDYLLPTGLRIGKDGEAYILIKDVPPLYRYAKDTGHIATYKKSDLDLTRVYVTNDDGAIVNELKTPIARQTQRDNNIAGLFLRSLIPQLAELKKNAGKGKRPYVEITYQKIYDYLVMLEPELNIEQRKSATNKRIYNVLEVLKMNGNIESFDAEIAKGKIRKYKIRIY